MTNSENSSTPYNLSPKPRLRSGLYLITREMQDTHALLAIVRASLEAGAVCVQYRDKSNDLDKRIGQASMLSALCDEFTTPFIINDDIELARIVGAQGVHLGQHDEQYSTARKMLGAQAIIGMSCYNDLERAREAQALGADYLAFGSFFASSSKPDAPRASLDVLHNSQTWQIPRVAIGGITQHNAHLVRAAGADCVALISDIFDAPDAKSAAQFYQNLFSSEYLK